MSDNLPPFRSDDRVLTHASRVPRRRVMLVATIVQTGMGLITKHRVQDLSSGGLRIDDAVGMQAGSTVAVSVGTLEATAASVKWVRDGMAGLAFEAPIDPEDERPKAAIAPSVTAKPKAFSVNANSGPTAGWIEDLRNTYRK